MATEDYFSIDDILSAEPRLYCTFQVRGYHLGHLDPIGVQAAILANPSINNTTSTASNHTPSTSTNARSTNDSQTPTTTTQSSSDSEEEGEEDEDEAALHIPANHRLALPFWLAESLGERNLISLHLPHCFKETVRHSLRADATSVNLHKLCASYYALGIRIAKLVKDITLPIVLGRAFANRCWNVVDNAAYSAGEGSKALSKLDRIERQLFFKAHRMTSAVVRWKERKGDRIVAFQPLLGKRNRTDDQPEHVAGSPITPHAASRVRVC